MTRALLAFLLLAAWGVPARAGEVTGVIVLPGRASPGVDVDLYGKYDAPESAPQPSDSELKGVIFLKAAAMEAPSPSLPMPVMDQKNTSFVPRIVPIPVGGRVRFLNSDPIFHNVFSLSPVKKFDLGRYPRGDSRVVTFDHPGVVQVFCDIHAEMIGFVVVMESVHYAVVDATGRYRIADVPAGSYDVGVWAEGMSQFEMMGKVSVPATGSVDFSASALEHR
jgi:plastocyanin